MTEIFGTLGPACAQADVLERMFLEGMTGMRLNLSHTGLKESEPLIQSFHKAAQRRRPPGAADRYAGAGNPDRRAVCAAAPEWIGGAFLALSDGSCAG